VLLAKSKQNLKRLNFSCDDMMHTRPEGPAQCGEGGVLTYLDGLNLSVQNIGWRVDLSGTIFNMSSLIRANFSGSSLIGTSFIRAHLNEAKFVQAELVNAQFQRAHAPKINLEKALLSRANLSNANCYHHLSRIAIDGVTLCRILVELLARTTFGSSSRVPT